jgi:hypothetical protein
VEDTCLTHHEKMTTSPSADDIFMLEPAGIAGCFTYNVHVGSENTLSEIGRVIINPGTIRNQPVRTYHHNACLSISRSIKNIMIL